MVVFSGAFDVEAAGVRVFCKPKDLDRLAALVRERCDEVRASPSPDASAAAR